MAVNNDLTFIDLEHEYKVIKRSFRLTGAFAFLVLASGAWFYHIFLHLSWLNAFYFCTITLTTVGYGDITPTTPGTKLFTMFYILIGIGVLAYFINLITKNAVARREWKKAKRSQAKIKKLQS